MSSHWVVTSNHIQLPISILSPRVGSTSTEAVALDEVDILVRKLSLPLNDNGESQKMVRSNFAGYGMARDVNQDEYRSLQLGNTQKDFVI